MVPRARPQADIGITLHLVGRYRTLLNLIKRLTRMYKKHSDSPLSVLSRDNEDIPLLSVQPAGLPLFS